MSYNIASFTGLALSTLLVACAFADEAVADKEQQRREVLDWLDTHVGDQQLLKPEDFSALFDQVANMPGEEFQEWLNDTRQLRKALQSQAWRETRAWLREFLAVQAIYSDAEIDAFKTRAANLSPPQLLDAMHQIRRKHQALISQHAGSEQMRRTNLRLRDDLIRRQQQTVENATAGHAAGLLHPHFGLANPGPARSSYAERMNVYRRIGFWPWGVGWRIW